MGDHADSILGFVPHEGFTKFIVERGGFKYIHVVNRPRLPISMEQLILEGDRIRERVCTFDADFSPPGEK